MQLPQIQINNTLAILGFEKRNATLDIRQPKAEVEMNQPQPDVEYIKSKSKLEIDQTEAFADANLKHPLRVVRESASHAKQKIMQGIAEEVSEGNRLMSIEQQKESVIPQIAKEESETPPRKIIFGLVPKSAESIKFRYQPSELEIKVNRGNFNINIKQSAPEIKFNPGDFRIYFKQNASMSIKTVGTLIDQKF